MTDEKNVTPESLLASVNKARAEHGGTGAVRLVWITRLQELFKSCNLAGKSVMYVDDRELLLETFAPSLIVATNDNAILHHHKEFDHTVGSLVGAIRRQNPDILLLDYNLTKESQQIVTAEPVVMGLRHRGFPGLIIGFSSEDKGSEAFEAIGVKAIEKHTGDPDASIIQLSQYLADLG